MNRRIEEPAFAETLAYIEDANRDFQQRVGEIASSSVVKKGETDNLILLESYEAALRADPENSYGLEQSCMILEALTEETAQGEKILDRSRTFGGDTEPLADQDAVKEYLGIDNWELLRTLQLPTKSEPIESTVLLLRGVVDEEGNLPRGYISYDDSPLKNQAGFDTKEHDKRLAEKQFAVVHAKDLAIIHYLNQFKDEVYRLEDRAVLEKAYNLALRQENRRSKHMQRGDEIKIGRDITKVDLFINSRYVSSEHLTIKANEDGSLTVTDHSMNGTIVSV